MRKLPLFLLLSLVANAALVAFVMVRAKSERETTAAATAVSAEAKRDEAGVLAAIRAGDLAQLKAAGFSEEMARNILAGRAFARLRARLNSAHGPSQLDRKYWRSGRMSAKDREESARAAQLSGQASKEFAATMKSIFGDEPFFGDEREGREVSFLAAEKQAKYRRIQDDYREMSSDVMRTMRGIELPSDVAHLRLLKEEEAHDIETLLTPEERQQLELRSSPTSEIVREKYGDYIDSEDVFKKIYALQKVFDEKYRNEEGMQAVAGDVAQRDREEVERAIRDALGADQVAHLDADRALQKQEMDPDFRMLGALSERLNLPPTSREQVMARRTAYAAESMRINSNAALSEAERQSQLQGLAVRATAEVQTFLGDEGAAGYTSRAGWISLLKKGRAFSTNQDDVGDGEDDYGGGVYGVSPPKAAIPPKT